MRKVAMLLGTAVLVGATFGIPMAVSMPVCTCSQEQTACTAYCQSILCRRAFSQCNPSDPCDATCTCSICAP
jgi:hypothetical protein